MNKHTTIPLSSIRNGITPPPYNNQTIIINAFGNPQQAAKHEYKIAKIMLKEARLNNKPKINSSSQQAKEAAIEHRRKAICETISKTWRRTAEISEILNANPSTISKDLCELRKQGKVKMEKRGNSHFHKTT